MRSSMLAEHLLNTIDWSGLHSHDGHGEHLRLALSRLLAAENADVAQSAYWGIENHAVVQGELFEVAEACTSILIAALANPRPRFVRIAVLELLFQILGGSASAQKSTPSDITQRCHRIAREGLLLLIREAIFEERDAALDVLKQLGEADRVLKLFPAESDD